MTSADDLRLAPFRAGDEEHIVDLYRSTFDPTFDVERWLWWYDRNPVGEKLIELAWSDDILAAHYAVCPARLEVHGETVLTSLSMHTMTHPEYRGRGLFPRLAERVYARMAELGYLMVWGFPNEMSHRGFVTNLAWSDVTEIPTLRLDVGAMPRPPQACGNVAEITEFDGRFDRLWQRAAQGFLIATIRDAEYLRWRYATHPTNQYLTYGFIDGDELLGYAVTKPYEGGLDLVDLLTVDDPPVASELVSHVMWHVRERGLSPVCAWLPVRHPTHHILERLGAENTGPVTYMGCRRLQGASGGAPVERAESWYYTMGDSDIY
jgi:GNAT superfamily N-acetyltransferase